MSTSIFGPFCTILDPFYTDNSHETLYLLLLVQLSCSLSTVCSRLWVEQIYAIKGKKKLIRFSGLSVMCFSCCRCAGPGSCPTSPGWCHSQGSHRALVRAAGDSAKIPSSWTRTSTTSPSRGTARALSFKHKHPGKKQRGAWKQRKWKSWGSDEDFGIIADNKRKAEDGEGRAQVLPSTVRGGFHRMPGSQKG